MLRFYSIVIFSVFFFKNVFAQQSKIDSIERSILGSDLKQTPNSYLKLAKFYLKQGDYNLCHENINKGIKLILNKNNKLLFDFYSLKGESFSKQGYNDSCLYLLKHLELNAERFNLKARDNIVLIKNIGDCYIQNNKFDSAFYYLIKAKDLNANIKNDTLTLKITFSFGNFYYVKDDYKNALDCYLKVLGIAQNKKINYILPKIYSSIGRIYQYRQPPNYLNSIFYFQKALDIYSQENDSSGIISVYIDLSESYLKLKNYDMSKLYIERLLNYYKRHAIYYEMMFVYDMLTELYIVNRDYINAKNTGLEALHVATELGDYSFISDAYNMLYTTSVEFKYYKEAVDYLVNYCSYKDSSLTFKTLEREKELEAKYELKTKNLTIKEQQQELELKSEAQKNQIIVIVSLVVFVLLLIAVFLYYRRYSVTKQKIESVTSFVEGQEEERKRISSDLHDSVCQQLVGLKLYTNRFKIIDEDKDKFDFFHNGMDAAINEVRQISHNLMPSVLAEIGFEEAIQKLVTDLKKSTGLSIDYKYSVDSEYIELHQTIKINLYRIIQEFFNNAIKHSHANEIQLQLYLKNNLLELTYKDNGKGMDTSLVSYGNGWKNIYSRIALLDAKIQVLSGNNKGVDIKISKKI